MKALILAAGRGKRLSPYTDDKPKAMVKVNDKTFLKNTLDSITEHNEIDEVFIVIGYEKEKIKQEFNGTYKSVKITYIDNDEWYKSNNVRSLQLALNIIDDDLLLFECDIFFRHDIIDFVFNNRDKNIVFASKFKNGMNGSVIELNNDNSIKRLLQYDNDVIDTYYKTINIYYFNKKFIKDFLNPCIDTYIKTHGTNNFYEMILGVLLYLKTPNIIARIVNDNDWFEVDTPEDLEKASNIFCNCKDVTQWYGGYWRYNFKDFCFLYNRFFPSDKFFNELKQNLKPLVEYYPSCQSRLCHMLSKWYDARGFNPDNLVIGNGCSEFIRILNRDIVKRVTVPVPGFNEYEDLPKDSINHFPLSYEDDFKFYAKDFIDSVKDFKSNVAIIVNPNNPTGVGTKADKIKSVLDALSDIDCVVVDESFIDYTGREGYTVQDEIEHYPNLVVLRSLSKEFGIAGLRLGYALTSNKKIRDVFLNRIPIWNVNSIGEFFIEKFPAYMDEYSNSIKHMIENREKLSHELECINGLEVIGSKANFILTRLNNGSNSSFVSNQLFDKYRCLVKDCSNKTGLGDKYIRISVGKEADNIFISYALRQVLD